MDPCRGSKSAKEIFCFLFFPFFFSHFCLCFLIVDCLFEGKMESGRRKIVLPKFKKKEDQDPKSHVPSAASSSKLRMPMLGDDDSDDAQDDDPLSRRAVNRRLQEQQRRAQGGPGGLHAKAHVELIKAVKVDPSVLEYDTVYDSFHAHEKDPSMSKDPTTGKADSPKPLFMDKLKKAAALREAEHELAFERQQVREREKEAEELGETEKFVTGSYLKKREERKKWEDVLRENEAEEEERARKGGKSEKDMRGFWNRMLNDVDDRKIHDDHDGNSSSSVQDVVAATLERQVEKDTKRPRDAEPLKPTDHDIPPGQRAKTMEIDEQHVITKITKTSTEKSGEDGEDGEDVWEKKMSDDGVSEARRRYLERKKQREEQMKMGAE
jgi:hypothetical protein